jgi:hypothetical protein
LQILSLATTVSADFKILNFNRHGDNIMLMNLGFRVLYHYTPLAADLSGGLTVSIALLIDFISRYC